MGMLKAIPAHLYSVQEHLEKRVLGIYTNAKFSAEATVLQ